MRPCPPMSTVSMGFNFNTGHARLSRDELENPGQAGHPWTQHQIHYHCDIIVLSWQSFIYHRQYYNSTMVSQQAVKNQQDNLKPVTGYATNEELELIDEAIGPRKSRSSFLIESAVQRAKEVLDDEDTTSN